MNEKFWMIVVMGWGCLPENNKIEPKDRPKYVHQNKESAEVELLRLAQRFPDDQFFLLETVAFAEQIPGTNVFRVESMEDYL